jgi:hypothetical protein
VAFFTKVAKVVQYIETAFSEEYYMLTLTAEEIKKAAEERKQQELQAKIRAFILKHKSGLRVTQTKMGSSMQDQIPDGDYCHLYDGKNYLLKVKDNNALITRLS